MNRDGEDRDRDGEDRDRDGEAESPVVLERADKGFQIIVTFERSDGMIMRWETVGTIHAGTYPYQLAAIATSFEVQAKVELERREVARIMQAQQLAARKGLAVPGLKAFPRPVGIR